MKRPDIEASRLRRARVMRTRSGKPQGPPTEPNTPRPMTLTPAQLGTVRDMNAAARAFWDPPAAVPLKRGRGAPTQLEQLHRTMAAHYLHLRRMGEKAIVAYCTVGDAWSVSNAAIEKAVRKHHKAAATLAAMPGIESNITVMATAFRALGLEITTSN